MKVVVENISIIDGVSKKDGTPYKRAVLEFNGQKASMFIGKFGQKDLEKVMTWKAGDEVDIIIEQSGEFVNFKIPSKTDLLEVRVKALEDLIAHAKSKQSNIKE